jgi:O-6-methylguanine DNA methyltransferase
MSSTSKTFSDTIRDVVRKIPRGSVLTYSEVARCAGNPRAARAVGAVMRKNFDPQIPCHRVIRSDGKIGEYNRGGSKKKREILENEGYNFNVKK